MPKLRNSQASRALMGRLWHEYVARHWPTIALALTLMVIEGSTVGLLSYMLQPMFDLVFVDGNVQAMWWVGFAILALFLVRAFTGVFQRVLMVKVAQLSSTAMQVDLLGHMMTLDTPYFQNNSPGALIERVQGDTLAVQNVWQVLIQGVGRDIVALTSLFMVALWVDWVWTVTALIGVPLLILPSVALQRYVRRKTGQMRDAATNRSTRLDEIFHGIREVKLNGMEAYQLGRFRRVVDDIVTVNVKTTAGQSMLPGLIDIMTGVGFFGVLILGGREIIEGDKTVGEFMSFFTAMALAFQPLRRLGSLAGIFQIAAASLERLYAIFDMRPGITSPAAPATVAAAQADVVLRDVNFSYDDTLVLNGLSFTAPAGKTTALVGASGAGKSTVFNVLTRLIEPQSGQVCLGDVPVGALNLATLRGLFSTVTQDALLFDETLRENILLGRTDVDEARLAEVLDAAHVADFLPNLPQGLDSPAGPRGSNLSGGQRQRVAIARALLRDTPILLLDEATSALDAQSEAVIQGALERLSQGRTTLVIAHRLATIRNADLIVVMDRGQVVEQGSHDELLAQGGVYARLHRLQFDKKHS
ncbi:ABC transporter ATP-binding protein [Oceaniglobus ichthyenteri]|uniref:ABC transporter ATP-binding protein n=1 Tax=Oceaniglobus ichthyenteri TaxID=2136177 RepID=UPI000D38FCBF|nr:ABC transporter ATP-binding protein [Oceaniglobus ichthyenteri]